MNKTENGCNRLIYSLGGCGFCLFIFFLFFFIYLVFFGGVSFCFVFLSLGVNIFPSLFFLYIVFPIVFLSCHVLLVECIITLPKIQKVLFHIADKS